MRRIDCQEIYADGRHYDCINAQFFDDFFLYRKLITENSGPVLECACGTGRLTIPFAEAGVEITGIDVSQEMLDHARHKAKILHINPNFVRADIRNIPLKRYFSTIFIPFNSLCHLHDHESLNCFFGGVRNRLCDGGQFIIDVFVPDLGILSRDRQKHFPVTRFRDPDGNGVIIITETNRYDLASQINHIKWYFQRENGEILHIVDLNMRMFFPQELDALLLYNGFSIEQKFGSYDMKIFDESSSKQILVCRKSNR